MNLHFLYTYSKRNFRKLEGVAILVGIIGACITLVIGGSVHPDTIRVVDVSKSMLPPYGEVSSSSEFGYIDSFTGWRANQSLQANSTSNSLVVSGAFQNMSTWTAFSYFKIVSVNVTAYPVLNINLSLTTGPRYGVRFFSQYPNGTGYSVWWEGSPLDHRPGIGFETLRVNMQREAVLATGHPVGNLTKIELYVEDPPYSPTNFQFVLSSLTFESYAVEQISHGQYHAVYFDLKNLPQENASWSLNKIVFGVTPQASQGTIFSVYLFDGPLLYASTTATNQPYNSITPFSQITFYPNVQPQIFPELLPKSNMSVVFVATTGALQGMAVQYASFEFLPFRTSADLTQQQLGSYYVYFIFFLFLLPLSVAILVFREFFPRTTVSKNDAVVVLIVGLLCRIALAATTAHVFDMDVYLTSIRAWFQSRTPVGSVGPTLPFTFFLYWIFYSPYALLQITGFQDLQFLGHAAGLVESVFVKLFPLAMDVTTFVLLLRFRKDGPTLVWATFYFLNPLSIFVSSVWGQYEAATAVFIVWGIYWMSRQKPWIAALSFVISGMIELLGFLPYLFLVVRTARLRLFKALTLAILALTPVVTYLPETLQIFHLLLGFVGVNVANGALSQPGRFSLFGNFAQLSIVSQFRPLLLSQAAILSFGIYDIFRGRMDPQRIVLYTALSSISFLLFSNLIAFWFWLLPFGLLYAIIRRKNDLGAFMLVYGTGIAFLEVSYAFSSNYLIFGNFGALLVGIEGIPNALKITSMMASFLAIVLLLLLKFGSGRAQDTMIRTALLSLSVYLLLYFWLGVYWV